MRRMLVLCAAWTALAASSAGHAASRRPSQRAPAPPPRLEEVVQVRRWHANGQLSEVRHLRGDREDGLQQAWTADGALYINYEMRNGRRYGLMNARPCAPVEEGP